MLESEIEYHVGRSRAIAPLFFEAPHPPQVKARAFQHAGVEFALARNHCLVGDEPGVGKTAQGILISNAIEAKRTLVVCPASLRLLWEREIWTWSNRPNVSTYPVQKKGDGINGGADYVIISYDLLRNPDIMAAIMALKWDHVILDEAHAIKSTDAKRTRAICDPKLLPSVTGRFTLLSGTILPNQPSEVYNVARLLDWSCIDHASLDDFRNRYYALGGGMVRSPVWDDKIKANVSKLHWSDTVRNVPTNLDDLQRRLRSKIMIRRLKDQVHTQLPAKQFHLVPLSITAEMRTALKHPGWGQVATLHDMDPDGFDAHTMPDGEISTARRLLGEAKAEPACAYIIDLLESGVQKVVVSAWHSSVLSKVRAKLERYGLVYMDGGTGMTARQKAVEAFQDNPDIRVILGQTAVIGEGHTLVAAQDVVMIEGEWVPGRITQMIDRVHRLGQTGTHVIAHIPTVPGSLDEKIIAAAVEKSRNIHAALDKV